MLTQERAKAVVTELCTANGRRKNPIDPDNGGCLNTDPRNPDRHCLVASVLAAEGVPLPKVASRLNGNGLNTLFNDIPEYKDLMTLDARDFLAYVQFTADGGYSDDTPLTWAATLRALREDGRL